MNSVQLIGNLTKDVDLRYSQSGMAIANFTIAVQRKYKNQNGERETDFIRCVAFKKGAEVISQYMKKGSKMGITGTIQTGSYENQQGQRVYTTDVIVEGFDFLDSKGQSNQQQRVNNNEVKQAQPSPVQQQGTPIPNDDDLPF